ncbi:MAG: phosphatase PAP2 family protein [Candidatus Abawacabacteria bacterium]|nr:phosphatase PAP2 family protein [Candidatus Abawacabacteria bacterium]
MFFFDQYLFENFNDKRIPQLKKFWHIMADARLIAFLLFAIPVVYLFFLGQFWIIIQMTISAAFSIIIGYILKAIILRPRPNNFVTYLGKFDSSFPSLHALSAFNLAYLLSIIFPDFLAFWIGIATFIGLSRIYIQVHYFTDVLGGVVLGSLVAWLVLFIS